MKINTDLLIQEEEISKASAIDDLKIQDPDKVKAEEIILENTKKG